MRNHPPTSTAQWFCVTALLWVAGCSTVAEKTTAFFSSDTPAIGTIDGRVLWGQANFTNAHEATVLISNTSAPSLACSGTMRYTSTHSGTVALSCSDGRAVVAPFQALSALSGAGNAPSGSGMFAFTYGLKPDKAAGYLAFPAEQLVAPVVAK